MNEGLKAQSRRKKVRRRAEDGKMEYFRERDEKPFDAKNRRNIDAMGNDVELAALSKKWIARAWKHQYAHHFKWLGRPILQMPQDIVAMQELIWTTKPEVVIETGVARGGSLVFHASMLALLGGDGEVIGIDIALREHNRRALKRHVLGGRIKLVSGSSIDEGIAKRVHDRVGRRKAMVVLDSNHTHDHVLKELRLYQDLVKKGGYLIVSDTFLEQFPDGYFPNRPWGRGNNPATAVEEFLSENNRFASDTRLVTRLGLTCCPNGYLKCIRN